MIVRLALVILTLALMGGASPGPALAQEVDRDRLAPLAMEAPAYAAFPPRILDEEDSETVTRIVFEARSFGVPFAIRVISVPTAPDLLGAGPQISAEVTRRLADHWLASEPLESSPGAADGILLLVVVPRDDHARSTAAFAVGPNALPQNGLTRDRLDAIVDDVMQPLFAESQVGEAIAEGAATVSYANLFFPSPRQEPTGRRARLHEIVNGPVAAAAVVAGLAACALAIRASRPRDGRAAAAGGLSPLAAAAIARGRVDDAVSAGALLSLIETGALVPRRIGRAITLALGDQPPGHDPFAIRVWQLVQHAATAEGDSVPLPAMRHLPRLLDPARAWLEDDLARRGLFDRRARIRTAWMLVAAGVALAAGLYILVPSIMGMARWGIFAVALTTMLGIGIAWWAARRSWATPAGEQALAAWLDRHADLSDPRRTTFDAIVRQELLLGIDGGRVTTLPTVRLVRSLRGLGAA